MRALELLAAGSWDLALEIDEVLMGYDSRFRRRIVLKTQAGKSVLVDLPKAARMRDGDGLLVDAGIVRIRAESEALMEVHVPDAVGLIRIAWHLGNRHLPVQLLGDHIRIREDSVIAQMIEGLGGHIHVVLAPFDPEDGAYASTVPHKHNHHDDDHD
jgi:urease accessory protein